MKDILDFVVETALDKMNEIYPVEDISNTNERIKIIRFLETLSDCYVLLPFPYSQEYMDKDWFDKEAVLIEDTERYGSGTYMIPLKRLF